jgi:hypothetical protein
VIRLRNHFDNNADLFSGSFHLKKDLSMTIDHKEDVKHPHPTKSEIGAHDYEEEMQHGRSGLIPSHSEERGKPKPPKIE